MTNKILLSKFTELIAAILLGYMAAWLMMHIHLPPDVIKIHEPSFLQILQGMGPAPDQYRLLQNHLMGLLFRSMDLYHTVFHFTAWTLTAAIFLFLNAGYAEIPEHLKRYGVAILALLYPVLMYNGPRGDSAFILLLSLGLVLAIEIKLLKLFFPMLIMMAFTRADIALFAAAFALLWDRNCMRPAGWVAVFLIPLAIQATLQFIVFPNASYYSKVIMVTENTKLMTMAATPGLLFVAATLLLVGRSVPAFFRWLFSSGYRGKFFILLFFGYVTSLATVAIVAETRLFLPLLPFLLLLIQSFANRPRDSA